LVTDDPFFAVLKFENESLDDMEEESGEKPDLQDTDHDGGAHEMGRFVKHFSAVHGPDARVDTDMDDQEGDQKNARKTHYEFFAYGRSKEFRPIHALYFSLFNGRMPFAFGSGHVIIICLFNGALSRIRANRANLVQEWLQNCFRLLFLRLKARESHKWPLFSILAAKFPVSPLV
jgi:hypothetical protein